jgi:hypothetical protein
MRWHRKVRSPFEVRLRSVRTLRELQAILDPRIERLVGAPQGGRVCRGSAGPLVAVVESGGAAAREPAWDGPLRATTSECEERVYPCELTGTHLPA